MTKSEFLEKAKKKYKNQLEIEDKWVSEMNFIYSPELVLRVWFDVKERTYMHRWCTTEVLV